ncbi:MAG: 16S rRNA (uracil(1498)-N(3))-methyltransferase [Rhodospirillales bacterium]|nr:16S rRNA (uracil(1498)-N(3))-methyltransferase [Rhodospirillales bacterium]
MSAPSIRLHVTAPLHPDTPVAASASQAHYLGHVMRRAPGETVRLFNGRDGEWQAEILALRRDQATLAARHQLRPQVPEPDLWLAFALLKRDATDLVVQKATELGAAALLPVLTERTQAARVNLDRLAAIAIEAAEQSERLTVPRIAPPAPLATLLREWPAERALVAAIERSAAAMIRPMTGAAGLLVGPEGGFTPRELDVMGRHPFVHPASLGPRVLRAETAAIVGLALLQAQAVG